MQLNSNEDIKKYLDEFFDDTNNKSEFICIYGFKNKEDYISNVNSYESDKYKLLKELYKLQDTKDIEKYRGIYDRIKQGFEDKPYYNKLDEIISVFEKNHGNSNDSIVKNFIAKLLFFIDELFKDMSDSKIKKVVLYGDFNSQEYLMMYYLTLIGFDVLILSTGKNYTDCKLSDLLLNLSNYVQYENFESDILFNSDNNKTIEPIKITLDFNRDSSVNTNKKRDELSYEELAKLASSVVMINIYDEDRKHRYTASGVVISDKGYILTTCVAVAGGYGFSIQFENSDELYYTNEVVKYHNVMDLALIRLRDIDFTMCKPISLYKKNTDLVRGQKVVAIGSPLGYLNSVSDGIISGFRRIDGLEMIQFTAPTSAGSTGGALLNMYGELIGISSHLAPEGQNINMAVNYKAIYQFTHNFI